MSLEDCRGLVYESDPAHAEWNIYVERHLFAPGADPLTETSNIYSSASADRFGWGQLGRILPEEYTSEVDSALGTLLGGVPESARCDPYERLVFTIYDWAYRIWVLGFQE